MRLLLAVLAAAVVGCGASSTEPPPAAPVSPPARASRPKLHMESELGQIDEAATSKTFARARSALMRCYAAGQGRLDYLAGDVKFFLRVQPDGHLRWAFVEQSTLGDHETEACMLEVLDSASWPLPDGGDAEVHQGLGFDPPPDARPPTDWSESRVAQAVQRSSAAASACKQHAQGTFQVTAYVGPDHGAGRVLAASVAPASAKAVPDADCLLGVVKAMKLPSPGSYPAKVSFSL
jgi:hypothetical protein